MNWKKKDVYQWHRWFAWYPVAMWGYNNLEVRWLEFVLRKHPKGTSNLNWLYKPITEQEPTE